MNRFKNPKIWLLILGLAFILIVVFWNKNQTPKTINQGKSKKKTSKIEYISTDFNQNSFTDGNELKLLKELKLCDAQLSGEVVGACSPKFFRFFHLNDAISLKNAFLLLINGIAYPNDKENFKSRRILIFEREKGQLVLTNAFKGNLIERHKNGPSTYDDLVIRFRLDQYNEAYHCLFKWKNGKYEFVSCEELFSYYCKGKVKPELKDSVSIEVNKILHEEKLLN